MIFNYKNALERCLSWKCTENLVGLYHCRVGLSNKDLSVINIDNCIKQYSLFLTMILK